MHLGCTLDYDLLNVFEEDLVVLVEGGFGRVALLCNIKLV